MRSVTLLLLFLAALLAGCSGIDDDPTAGWSASRIYNTAKDYLNSGNYQEAVKYFEALEARYPFGRFAEQAQLEIAYAYYKYDEPDLAIAAADRFIKLHPRHRNVPYAYYLKGLANLNRGHALIDRWLPRDYAANDARPLVDAFRDFKTIVQRWPDSRYAEDARQRLKYIRNLLARHELLAADYYMRRGAWLAAAKRGAYIVEHYQGSSSVPDALRIMAEAYEKLGMNDLARDARRVLELNFPQQGKAGKG